MQITLSPIASVIADQLPLVTGNTFTYRGETYDLSALPDGATVEADSPFVGSISRVNGELQFILEYCYNAALAELSQSNDWADYTFTVTEAEVLQPGLIEALSFCAVGARGPGKIVII